MVDLHAHSDRSDGLLSPEQLVDLACQKRLRALAITDHDSVEGYDVAVSYARRQGLELVCGVELNSQFHGRAIHILGYFLEYPADQPFREHLSCLQEARRERNARLATRLRQLGLEVRLEDAEQLGRSQTGRPHFARVLVDKGYVRDIREAFDRYLDESAPGYVERRDPPIENILRWIRESGGISSWAHPARFIHEAGLSAAELFGELAAKGLNAIEVYHTDHGPDDISSFRSIAGKLGLCITGGSDFHAPEISRAQLGSLNLPLSLLEDLKTYSHRLASGNGKLH